MNIVKIVGGDNLKELIANALSGYHVEYYDIQNVSLDNPECYKTVVTGEIDLGYWDNEEYIEGVFDFEVNIGTHKDDLVLFDEFEVVIE